MSRKRTVLHSHERHRNRNYKRRIRNLFLEILFIIIFVFVAIKFVKNDEETPTVKMLGTEEQKEIINNEMQENNDVNHENKNERELQIPEVEKDGITIIKAVMTFTENQKQSIINIEVMNYGKEKNSKKIPINLVDSSGTVLEETYVNVQELEPKEQIRLNIVCENNLSEATKIEIRDERVY